jgi:hypothetical protein
VPKNFSKKIVALMNHQTEENQWKPKKLTCSTFHIQVCGRNLLTFKLYTKSWGPRYINLYTVLSKIVHEFLKICRSFFLREETNHGKCGNFVEIFYDDKSE